MKPSWTVAVMLSVGGAIAQHPGEPPAPPPMRGDAASLKDTMKFIQDKLPSRVNYVVYGHDNITGVEAPAAKRSFELSNVYTDDSRCSVRFHWRLDTKGSVTEKDGGITLKEAQGVEVAQLNQVLQRAVVKS